ncbi:MAG: GNAT family N-acetyltransferase [Propionibacteriaceae bacterium]|nr:GNAT family N-acetyltransferase [Propionibacteriaceae bacterium]
MARTFAVVPSSYVFLRRGDEVLLQLRQNTGYMDGRWVAGAAGHVEQGETARQAAVREAAEELGITIRPEDLTLISVMQRTDRTDNPREQRADWFWTATEWKGTPAILEEAKAVEARWWPLHELPDKMPDYERQILEALAAGTLEPDTSFGFDGPTVRLRPMQPGDEEVFSTWNSDPEFCEIAGWTHGPHTENIAFWTKLVSSPPPDLLRLIAEVDGDPIGFADLHGVEPHRRELGFLIGSTASFGKGLGTAIARAGLEYGFERLGLVDIWAEAADANAASVAVLQKVGMRETGRGDEVAYLGEPSFYRQFVVTREEFA